MKRRYVIPFGLIKRYIKKYYGQDIEIEDIDEIAISEEGDDIVLYVNIPEREVEFMPEFELLDEEEEVEEE